MRLSIEAGLTIATGTDCPGECAQVGKEIAYLHNLFGMSALEAIQCGTANWPFTLGGMAPKSGQLREGYIADIIGLAHDV